MADGHEVVQRLLVARPPAPAIAAARLALQDHVASSLMARQEPAVTRLLAHASAQGRPHAGAPVLGHDELLARGQAALVGGFQAHLLDVDDTHEDVRGHPSAVLLPTLLALAEGTTPVSRLLESYVVGVEVMARLGRALGPGHYAAGWHPTGTAGAVAAAAAGAHLLRLAPPTAGRAMSLAASQAGGLRLQFGTEAKPLHAGLAAQSGVQAVELAVVGITANADPFDPLAGFLAVHDAQSGLDQLLAPYGPRWHLLDPGLWFKQYPYCSAAMSAGDAAALLAEFAAEGSVEQVTVRVPRGADAALRHTRPRTGEEGRFSLEYVTALRLTGTAPDLDTLGPAPVDPALDALVTRVVREHHAPPPGPGRSFRAQVEVLLHDGRSRSRTVEHPVGSPRCPLGAAEHAAKLRAAAGGPRPAAEIARALTQAPTVGSLMTAIATAVAPTAPPRKDPDDHPEP